MLVRWLTPDGKLEHPSFNATTFEELGQLEPEGIYTIARTYGSDQVVMFEAHLARLEHSARLESISLKLDHKWLRSGLCKLIKQAGYAETRFRIMIPRDAPGSALLAAEPLAIIPNDVRMGGVGVATLQIERPNPQAKSNRWVSQRSRARKMLPGWAYEGLICTAEGVLLEGFSSNFYVVQGRTLRTARDTMLSGIAREILLNVVEGFLDVEYRAPRMGELGAVDEALITSSSRGVLPIVRVDDQSIGTGKPGELTLELWQRYQNWVDANKETL